MGSCNSSNDKNEAAANLTGPGLPPQQIVPQPVEVVNLEQPLETKIVTPPENNLQTSETIQCQSVTMVSSQVVVCT